MNIYVIYGSTGEYSDRSEWSVAAVNTEAEAQRYVSALEKQYLSMPQEWHDDRWDHEEKMKERMTLDPNFACDYTGTQYFYGKVEMYPAPELDRLLTPLASA
jgi:hypothetical protein